jgi:hypothetical protein
MGFAWDDDAIAFARRHWEDPQGLRASEIAKELGCSRNAVIGKMHRKGFECGRGDGLPRSRKAKTVKAKTPRKTSSSTQKNSSRLGSWRTSSKGERTPPKVIPIVEDRPATSVPLFGTDERDCKWPTSADVLSMEVCGQASTIGAYCDKHAMLAYRQMPSQSRVGSFRADNVEHTKRLCGPLS